MRRTLVWTGGVVTGVVAGVVVAYVLAGAASG